MLSPRPTEKPKHYWLAVDPGTEKSGWVIYDAANQSRPIVAKGVTPNAALRDEIRETYRYDYNIDCLIVEMMANYGKNVGVTTFKTCVWIGRFVECWAPRTTAYIYRRDVKLELCESTRAGDPQVLAALASRYGGDRKMAVGTKQAPGPLHGISSHMWSALGLAETHKILSQQGRVSDAQRDFA